MVPFGYIMERSPEQLRSMLTGVVAIVFVLIVVAIAYHFSRPQPAESLTDSRERSVASTVNTRIYGPKKEADILFTKNGFVPKKLTVKKGAVVTVENDSSDNVQFSSGERSPKRVNSDLNLRTLLPGEDASFIAKKVGSWKFRDSLGGEYTGTLTVIE